jgi:hypothetical protein
LKALTTPAGKVVALFLFLLTLAGGLGGIPPLVEAYENLTPDIRPHDTVDGSSLVLPFTVKNKSGIFAMNATKFVCGVDLVYAIDSAGQVVVMRDEAFSSGIYSIPANSSLTYPCNAAALLQVRSDGTLSAFGSSTKFVTQEGEPIIWHPPFRILKMCIWIGGDFYLAGFVPRSFKSEIDQWPAAPTLHQWIEGPIAPPLPGQDAFANLPKPSRAFAMGTPLYDGRHQFRSSAFNCNQSLQYPYGLTTGEGQQIVVFEPMRWYQWVWHKLV